MCQIDAELDSRQLDWLTFLEFQEISIQIQNHISFEWETITDHKTIKLYDNQIQTQNLKFIK